MIKSPKIQLSRKVLSCLLALWMLAALVPVVSYGDTDVVPRDTDVAARETARWISEIVHDMTTEEKVCQMLMPAFRYYQDQEGKLHGLTALNQETREKLEKYGFAGVILFAANAPDTAQTARLIDDMQQANSKKYVSGKDRSQLLMAVDQEGGRVMRLGHNTAFSGNMALGAVGDVNTTKAAAGIIGRELVAVGFNTDFAPVVDVNNNPANPVIGVRSFSDNSGIVASHGVAFLNGLMEAGAIATLKHFPGHGDTETDSHTGLPRIDKTYGELQKNELVPFQACIDAGAEAVMTAHIQYPAIEKTTYISKESGQAVGLPATLSKTILTDILRNDMGFEGVVVSDSMTMDAISRNFDQMDTAKMAIEAGVDIILIPVDDGAVSGKVNPDLLDDYIANLTAMVDSGKISMDRVNQSVRRVLGLKASHGLLDPYDGSDFEKRLVAATATVGSKENHAREWDMVRKSITLVKNQENLLPVVAKGKKIAVLTADDSEVKSMEYALGLLKNQGKITADPDISVTSLKGKTEEECLAAAKDAQLVIVVSEVSKLAALNPASEAGAYSAMVDRLIAAAHQAGGKIAVVSAALPYDAARYTDADAFVIAWNNRGMSEDPRGIEGQVKQYGAALPAALYQMLSPDGVFTGKLPVNIPALDKDYGVSNQILYARGTGLRGGFSWNLAVSRKDAARLLCSIVGRPELADSDTAKELIGAGKGETTINRQDFITGLYNLARFTGADVTTAGAASKAKFIDEAAISDYARTAVEWAASKGIIKGTASGTLSPNSGVSRAQALTMLMRYQLLK